MELGSILAALEDGAVLVQAQAIDKLMDIFSDDYVRDTVYVASGCQEKASTAIDALKAKLRNVDERKALGREEQALQMAAEMGITAAQQEGMSREELMEINCYRQISLGLMQYR